MPTWDLLEPEALSERSHQIFDALNDERDLACVLISASFLDECVACLIGRRLVADRAQVQRLMAPPQGHVSTSAARIRLAYLLGLITPKMRENLVIVAKIRNLFAHSAVERRFGDKDIAALCERLQLIGGEPDFVVGYDGPTPPPNVFASSDPRTRFILTASTSSMRLLVTALGTKHADVHVVRGE